MMSNYTSNKPTTATADPKWAHFVVEKTHRASFSIPADQDHGEVSIDSNGHIDISTVDFPVVVHQNINGNGDDDANVDMFDDPSPDVTDADCDRAYANDKATVLSWVLAEMKEIEAEIEAQDEVGEPRAMSGELTCTVCDKAIVCDSAEHDQSILVNCGDEIICPDCPRKCKAECGECVVCEETGDPSESESEEELEGDWCYGATDPRTVITYTMAGGGAHWWKYEVHFDVDVQKEVYVNNTNGRHRKRGEKLFFHKDQTDQLRLEHNDFDLENEDWVELML